MTLSRRRNAATISPSSGATTGHPGRYVTHSLRNSSIRVHRKCAHCAKEYLAAMGRSPSRNKSLSPEWRATVAQDRARPGESAWGWDDSEMIDPSPRLERAIWVRTAKEL